MADGMAFWVHGKLLASSLANKRIETSPASLLACAVHCIIFKKKTQFLSHRKDASSHLQGYTDSCGTRK
jgi:hypothetical protein